MENQCVNSPLSFTISTQKLYFTYQEPNLKFTVKNISLKTTSYEIVITDQQHFKIVNTARSFSLAPGIHKQIIIRHMCGEHCQIPERLILQARIRDSNNKWVGFQCRCPSYEPKKQKQLIQYPNKIQLGEFDQKIKFEVEFKNISQKNLKIIFLDRLQTKNNTSQTNIFIIDTHKKLMIKNLTNDTILLVNQTLIFQFQLNMGQHGELKQKLDFIVVIEELSSKFMKNKQIISSFVKEDSSHKYFINLQGYSVSKKLIIKDQNTQQVSQIRNQLLTGTSKSSFFFIQTQYHEDMPYTLQAYFQTEKPEKYAQKWQNITIQFIDSSAFSTNQQKTTNSCSGVLKTKSANRIQYRVHSNYTINDQNYVAKYSKIQFQDDSNALRMRNSQYSKKYEDLQVKIKVKFQQENKTCKSIKTIIKNTKKNYNIVQTIIPFKFILINPSLRCQVSEQDQDSQSTNVIIFNETKISIPYSFPKHSLYRIINSISSNQCSHSILQANKKQSLCIKWTKSNERCAVFMEIPSFDLVLYQTRENQLKQRNIICLPPSRRRPQTSISSVIKAKQRQVMIKNQQYGKINKDVLKRIASQPTFNLANAKGALSRPSSVYPLRSDTSKTCRIVNQKRPQTPHTTFSSSKKPIIYKDLSKIMLSKGKKIQIPQIQQLNYLVQLDKIVKNTHPTFSFVLQILDTGFLVLPPGQCFVFDTAIIEELGNYSDGISAHMYSTDVIRYKVYGHNPIYRVKLTQSTDNFISKKQIDDKQNKNTSRIPQNSHQISNMYQPQTYQILSREVRMSFKQSKQQFEIIQPILIKNCSNQPLQVNCVSIDGQFFKCKEPNSLVVINPEQIGKLKIGFQPENTVRLSILNKQPPKQLRRKAIVQSDHDVNIKQSITMVRKQIKLLINKKIQTIMCIGQIIQKSCSIKPYQVKLTNCKYGSPQIVQTMIITNTSPHKINFIIQNPNQISIKPKTGSIMPKCTQNCTISFKPCKKISNFQDNIKIFIGGSHLELVPLHINVADPQIFIKQMELIPNQNAICGTQMQELNLQMTIINNNPSQSFIEINMKNTPLYLGYTKNYHSPDSGLVMENFIRCSQIIEQSKQLTTYKNITKYPNNSLLSIVSQDNLSQVQNTINQEKQKQRWDQVCSITVVPNSFLIVPLTLRVQDAKIGNNVIKIQKNIATLVGFGQIKSPNIIRFNCNKTLLHITPFKQFSEIILTQSQKNYQINLKNMSDKMIKIQTRIKQIKKSHYKSNHSQYAALEKKCSQKQPSIICTFKDINQFLKPQASIDLNMSFICFEAEKQKINAQYQLAIFVKQEDQVQFHKEDCISEVSSPYFTTTINVIVPEPFLQIVPNVLVMPTVGVNGWSRQTFLIKNNGFKEIFIKIKKPANIVFQMQCQIMCTGGNTSRGTSKDRISNISGVISSQKGAKQSQKLIQNQLTKINNVLQVRVSWRSKTKISFKCMLQIEDNFNKSYQMAIVGTCTDSPFFVMDGGIMISSNEFNSHESFCSEKSLTSSATSLNSHRYGHGLMIKKSNLQPTDIEDLLFLNNWVGSLIPQISNQSTFFYVWLTKIQNFIKFLNEFNVTLNIKKPIQFQNSKQKNQTKQKYLQKLTLTSIFQQLKQQGFQLNSLRIDLLQKADQLEWLNFMWFFLSKSVISPNFIPWLSKNTTIRETQQINYRYVLKNFQQLLTILMTTLLDLKKESNNNKSIDWKYLIQNFEPLLQNFNHVESRRHLILSLNLMYLKLNNIEKQIIEISDFEFVLSIHNVHNRRVRYYLQCNTKFITCEQSSNKVMPTQTPHGYTFVAEQRQQMTITFSLRNYTVNTLTVITKNILDITDITMYNNIIWDPITILHLRLKRKQDILHHVNIQCENKSSQEWIYKFQSKISAQYRIFFDLDDESGLQSMKLLTGQPGFLKKGQSITIRVIYTPENMSKCEASLRIVNTMVKQVFKIHGKPIHSSKIQNQKSLKIIQNQTHTQSISIPWQIATQKSSPAQHHKKSSSSVILNQAPKFTTSSSSRNQVGLNLLGQKHREQVIQQNFNIKLYDPSNPSVQPTNKYLECLLSKTFDYNPVKKQLTITLTFKYQILIRDLQLIFQVTDRDYVQSKLIRIVVDVIPKPILIQAEIQSEYNIPVVQNLRIPNITKIPQSITVQYGYIQALVSTPDSDKKQQTHPKNSDKKMQFSVNAASSILQNIHKGLFEVVKVKNNQNVSFVTKGKDVDNQKILDYVDIGVRYHPNQNNCYYSQNDRVEYNSNGNATNRTRGQANLLSQTKKKIISRNNSSNQNQNRQNNNMDDIYANKTTQLPYFFLTATYTQSLYKITYLFKPSIKKSTNKINCLLQDQKKDILHECAPLRKYTRNYIQIDNSQSKKEAVYEVQTDLYEISGNNQFVIQGKTVGKYYYDIYCLHLGKKQGKIKFRQVSSQDNDAQLNVLDFNVIINISETAKPPNGEGVNECMPKGSCQQQGLRIYNQYFQITSAVRKLKVFSIFLANMSQKEIQYEVKCDSEYLHPRVTTNHSINQIKIPKLSQYELQIQFLPYFIGKKQARLNLYNPHQPQITYRISMIAEENIQTIIKQMSKIGQNKPIQITVENPLTIGKNNSKHSKVESNDSNTIKNKLKQADNVEVDLELIQVYLNKNKIREQNYNNYIKILQQSLSVDNISKNEKENSPSDAIVATSKDPFKLTLKFCQSGLLSHQNKPNIRKFYLYFMTQQLLPQYNYELVFLSQKYGQYNYRITYKYPSIQKMQQKIIFIPQPEVNNGNKVLGSSAMIKVLSNSTFRKGDNKFKNKDIIEVSVPFVNRFNQHIQLALKCRESIHSIKLLHSGQKNEHQKAIQNQNTNKIIVPPFTKQEITFQLTNNTRFFKKDAKSDSQISIQVQSVKNQKFVWIYPITIYRVCSTPQRVPVQVTGQARQPIYVKIHPLIAYRVAKIQLFVNFSDKGDDNREKQILKSGQEMQIQLKLKQDIIRKRIIKQVRLNNQSQLNQITQLNSININIKPPEKCPPLSNSNQSYPIQIPLSGDRLIPHHLYLNQDYIYEVQVQINTVSAIKGQGYFYVYQTIQNVQSKNLTPAVSQKSMFKIQEDQIKTNNIQQFVNNKTKPQNLGYFVQKIPFMLKIDRPKIEVLQFEANVGDKATIKLKLQNLNKNNYISSNSSSNKLLANTPKVLDYILGTIKNQVKIELHNNKCREFSAFFNEIQSCIEVTYYAQEYSGLKKGMLQISIGGVYSQYQLIGKFPKNQRNQKEKQKLAKRISKFC